MARIHLYQEGCTGMSNYSFKPKGRRSLPLELLQFGRHLVYSEGTKTEPYYVDNIKSRIANKYKCNQNDIELIPVTRNKSYNTLSLVNYAIKDVKERLHKKETIDHVWILFDKDDFEHFDEAHSKIIAINNSNDKNIEGFSYEEKTGITWHSCWSNESFELWLCLYFNLYTSANSRKDYITHLENLKTLKAIKFSYEKNLKNIHDILENNGGSINNAIKYAKKLEKSNYIKAPSTGMYIFAEYFLPYMD